MIKQKYIILSAIKKADWLSRYDSLSDVAELLR